MFKNNLYNILKELDSINGFNESFSESVNDRLSLSLEDYKEGVQETCEYLLNRDNMKLIRNMNKYL